MRSAYKDFHAHEEVWARLRRDLYSTPGSPGPQMIEDGPSLYLLMRLLKPASVMETGVAAGVSSCFILQAMQDNNKGHLYSIEAQGNSEISPYQPADCFRYLSKEGLRTTSGRIIAVKP